jgi:FkbM family methyltransferase
MSSAAVDDATAQNLLRMAVSEAGPSPRFWLDIGTSHMSLTKWDVERNSSIVVVGVDALRANVEHPNQPRTQRFVRFQGACMSGGSGTTIINVHRSPTCGSILRTNQKAPPVGVGRHTCTGDTPTPTVVPRFPLSALLKRIVPRFARRIELLKIDVQGAELSCLQSAGHWLQQVDNVLLEVQDATQESGMIMYEGAPTIEMLDAALSKSGHERQYCEWNHWMWKWREFNCLYSSKDPNTTRLWATANWQNDKHSMVSHERYPDFRRFAVVSKPFNTTAWLGARVRPSSRFPFRVAPLERIRADS